jgi:zinc D-Ala-D-Ala carboxypeptidase
MKLSQHFTLAEATKSQTASRLGIDNAPDAETIERMKLVCENILEPVRTQFNLPVTINSFYRSPRLNAEVGSKASSQHVKGEAVDFEVPGIPNAEVAEWVRDNLDFDQCIKEFVEPAVEGSGWVHVSYVADGNRGECLTVNSSGTIRGL